MNCNRYILNELNKGIKMGMDSISNVSEKVQDDRFKQDLKYQYDEYNKILNEVNNELTNYDDFPKELNPMQKAAGWMGVEMGTLTDKSNSKIAEMMLQGTNMGIIEGRRILNNKVVNEEVEKIVDEYVGMQEKYVEILKTYL